MKSKKLVLLMFLPMLILSSCNRSTLYGDKLIKLSSEEVFRLSKEVLLNRTNVKKLVTSVEKKEYEISETVHLNSTTNNMSYDSETLIYDNHALSSVSTLKTTNSITATGFTTSSIVNKTFSSWIMNREGEDNLYSRYSYFEESYNKGYVNSSYDVDDVVFTFEDIDMNWDVYKLSYLFNFDSNNLFNSNDYVFAKNSKDKVIAYRTVQNIEMVINPLYPDDANKKLPTLEINSFSYIFTKNNNFGYVLSEINFLNQKKLLENFSNKYLSSPKLIYETNQIYKYSYGTDLPSYTLPTINDGVSASFSPLISSFDSDGAFLGVSLKEDVINLTSVYLKDHSNFNGYAYSISLKVTNTDYSYSFTARDNLNLDEPIYNEYGYIYINKNNVPKNLISEIEDEDNPNRFKFSRTGEYNFFMLYSNNYRLISASLQIISID